MGPVVTRITRWLLPWLLAGLTLGAAAQELVSVRGAVANLRAGYPLQVLRRAGDWVQLRGPGGQPVWAAAEHLWGW